MFNDDEKKSAFKEYKKTIKKECKSYHNEFVKTLRKLRSTDPKAYWNLLNKNKKNNSKTNYPTCSEFFEHFTKLQECDENDMDDSNEPLNEASNEFLNAPFTKEEVIKCIDKLKTIRHAVRIK